MHVMQEAPRGIGKAAEEDVHCIVDLVVELLHGCNVEKTVE